MLHHHTFSYHCASTIADCSNTGQRKNNIFYLLSSLQRQHHHSTSLTAIDPSLHDGLSRRLGKSFRRSFGSAAGSSCRTAAATAPATLSGGQRGRRGRAAAEASAVSAAGADARPADPPAAASGPSRKGQGYKTDSESVMIGMNALIDLEDAAGTLSVECHCSALMNKVCT
jgi:hypothetical protein